VAKKPRTPPPPRSGQKGSGQSRPVQAPQRRDPPKAARSGIGSLDRRWLFGGGALVLAVVVVVLVLVLTGGSSSTSSTAGPTIDWSTIPNLQKGSPPWAADWQQLPDRLQLLGLSQLSAEGTVIHWHQYLVLYVNGQRVTLPPNVGIYDSEFITELHVHVGEPNIIHVESPTQKSFALGQVFGEWGVRLTSRCVGRFCGKLSWWVNGKRQTGDPARLVLKEHQVIEIALGKAPKVVSSFDFAKLGL
jgi:hypothetical protein